MIVQSGHGLAAAELLRFGNPWHGRFENDVLTLPNAATLPGAIWTGTDCHLIDFGMPGPDPAWASPDGSQALRTWAILHGPDKRYSPKTRAGLGPFAWVYRAADGAVWMLSLVALAGTRTINGQARQVVETILVNAIPFGRFGFAPGSAQQVASRAVADLDDLTPYEDDSVYSAISTITQKWIVNQSPAGGFAALNLYLRRPAPKDQSFGSMDFCWAAQVSGGSASAAPDVTLSFVGSSATLGQPYLETFHPMTGDFRSAYIGPGWANPWLVYPFTDSTHSAYGDDPALAPADQWPPGCSWTLDVQIAGPDDRTITVVSTISPVISDNPAPSAPHWELRTPRIAVASDGGVVVLGRRCFEDHQVARSYSPPSGQRTAQSVRVQHRYDGGIEGHFWADESTDITGNTSPYWASTQTVETTTVYSWRATIGGNEVEVDQWREIETVTSGQSDSGPLDPVTEIEAYRGEAAISADDWSHGRAPGSLVGISGYIIMPAPYADEPLPVVSNNCIAFSFPWAQTQVSGATARYVAALIDIGGAAELPQPAFLAGDVPLNYSRLCCSLHPKDRTPAVGIRPGWI